MQYVKLSTFVWFSLLYVTGLVFLIPDFGKCVLSSVVDVHLIQTRSTVW